MKRTKVELDSELAAVRAEHWKMAKEMLRLSSEETRLFARVQPGPEFETCLDAWLANKRAGGKVYIRYGELMIAEAGILAEAKLLAKE